MRATSRLDRWLGRLAGAVVLAAVLAGANASGAAAAGIVPKFKVSASTAQSKINGQRALLIKSLVVSDAKLKKASPKVTCDRKGCVRVGHGKFKKQVTGPTRVSFKRVSWLLRPGEKGITVRLVPKSSSLLGRYIRFAVTNEKRMRLVPTITGCVTSTAAAIACPGIQDPTSGGLATSILLGEAGIAADTPAIAQDATGDTSVVSIRDTGAMNEFQNSRGSALWTEQQLLGVNGAKGSPTARALDDGTVSFAYARGEGGLSIGVLRDGVLENTMRLPVTVVTSGCVRSLNFPERYWFTTALNGELIILRMSSTPRWVTTDGATKATGCIAPVFFGGVSWVNANASGALIIQPLVEFTGIGSLAGTQRSATQLAADGGSNGCPAASGREDQGLDIASISQAGVLTYYANTPPATTFTSAEIDIKKKFIGCPSMIERSDKSIVLAVAASDGSLWLYAKAPGSPTWTSRRLTRAGASNGKLVMIERPDHELNIVSATPNMSLRFFAFD